MSTLSPVAAQSALAYKQTSNSLLAPLLQKCLVKLTLAILAGHFITITATPLFAGGGPENVILLVNSNSDASKTIANHYINWRHIPASNVLYLNWKGSPGEIAATEFRDSILLPTLVAIDERHLGPQIDYVVYSSDFPWRVDLQKLYPDQKFPPEFIPLASINGVTYLANLILPKNPAVVLPDINWYVPGPLRPNLEQCHNLANVPTRAFRSKYLWDQNGKRTEGSPPGQGYLLSTVLGITRGRGNTVDEVLSYLQRSVMADGTRPNGNIYFMWNKDVRSFTRDKCFPAIAAQINLAGGHAVVQQGRIPTGAKNVAGMMVGAQEFNLVKEGVKILPGAICEHLTSEGGIITPGGNQTPLSAFLREGAAGSSGTVAEPRALQAKFPLPSIQLHYVRGCSLAEAFYQSVSGPYQLLIVGDPLCQPWADVPKISVAGVKPDEKVKGSLSLMPSGPSSVGSYELYVDGRLTTRTVPGKPLPWDTTQVTDGHHELRVVGIRSDQIETQGRIIVPVFVNNHEGAVQIKVGPTTRITLSGKLKISLRQPGATSFKIRQNSRDLGSVKGESGELEILATTLGRGPTTLQAISEGKAPAASVPVRIVVE
jgi:hypothetical protein